MSYKTKGVNKWTVEEVCAWLQDTSINNFKQTQKDAFCVDVRDNECDGSIFLPSCADAKTLYDDMKESVPGLRLGTCTKIVTALLKFQNDFEETTMMTMTMNRGSAYSNNNASFTVLVVNNGKNISVPNMTNSNTINDLKRVLIDREGIPSGFGLSFGRTGAVNDTSTLQAAGVKANSVLTVVFKASGGTTDPNINRTARKDYDLDGKRRHVDWTAHPELKKSKKADCLFTYKISEGYSVVDMSCGHAMESKSMFMYIDSIFDAHDSAIKVVCPMPGCNTEWDWQRCCWTAGMTTNEYCEYSALVNKRSRNDIRDCPHCKKPNERKAGVAILRMRCVCSSNDWCWVCVKPWKTSGLMVCGNANCAFLDNVNLQLSACKWSKPYGWENFTIKLPDMRACPHCLSFMGKSGGCKYMKCKSCQYWFCYSCLTIGNKTNEFSPGCTPNHTTMCPVAQTQKFT